MGRSVQLEIDGLILRLQHNQEEGQLLALAKEASQRIQEMRQLAPGAAQQMCILTVLLQILQEKNEKTHELADLQLVLERTKEENRFLRQQILKAQEEVEISSGESHTAPDIATAQQDMADILADLQKAEGGKAVSTPRSLGRNPLLERQKTASSPKFNLPGRSNNLSRKGDNPQEKSNKTQILEQEKAKNSKKKLIFEANGEGDSLFERQLNFWQTLANT